MFKPKKWIMMGVIRVEPMCNGRGRKMYGLRLECGHFVERYASSQSPHFAHHTKARCYICAKEYNKEQSRKSSGKD